MLRDFLALPALVAATILLAGSVPGLFGAEPDPLSRWSVEDGYSLRIVAAGFDLPTSIAVVKNPGPDPGAPRMFVTELRGTIKAVANDGTVTSLDHINTFKPDAEWPADSGEAGMAGICLADPQGYIFVTYAYRDKWGVLRNGVTRLSMEPHTFAGRVVARDDYVDMFRGDTSAFSHQIGGCAVDGDAVYIGIGDGGNPASSRSLDRMLGKIIRLTLDGRPYPTNPFAAASGRSAAVYAYGLRNPFGLTVVDGHLLVAENGVDIDRFLEVRAGVDYGWDGTDGSIATNAAVVFTPTICPVQVAFAPVDQHVLKPESHPRFLIASSDSRTSAGIVSVEYDPDKGMALGSPRQLVLLESPHPGEGVVGLALAPDGLYFCPILPVGKSGALMMIRYDPAHAHSRVIGRGEGPAGLIASFGCLKCHSLDGKGGTQGPALDRNSLLTRVQSRVLAAAYPQFLARLESIPDEAIRKGREARKAVASANVDDRVRLWVVNRLLNPKFDEPNAQMPTLGMTRDQAESIASYLLHERPKQNRLKMILLSRRFLAGVGLGFVVGIGLAGVVAVRSRRRAPRA
jgi:glucose/arabinose dehydrogenase